MFTIVGSDMSEEKRKQVNQQAIKMPKSSDCLRTIGKLNIDTEAFKKARISHEVLKEILVIVKRSRSMITKQGDYTASARFKLV